VESAEEMAQEFAEHQGIEIVYKIGALRRLAVEARPPEGPWVMSSWRRVVATAVVLLAASWPACALADSDADRRGFVLYGMAGGFAPLSHLDDAETTNFRTGLSIGGGLAYQFNRHLALRGTFTFARAEAQVRPGAPGLSVPLAGARFDRYLYDADLQLRRPFEGGTALYAFVGGGAVTVDQAATPGTSSFTKAAAKLGIGLGYEIPRSNAGLYIEATTWVYDWDRYGFDRRQFDTTWIGGILYRFGR
jgi:hypothetical protein